MKIQWMLPHPIVEEFVKMNITPQNAIDLGGGAGRDTIYLIKNGWNVLAIDREDTKELISRKLDNEELKRLEFCCENFENVELRKTGNLGDIAPTMLDLLGITKPVEMTGTSMIAKRK